MTARNPAFAVK
ncbi:unnamed protein product, partial [Rotaria sp. Silwood1]